MVVKLTKFASLFAFGLVDDTVGAFAHDSNDLVLVHLLSVFVLLKKDNSSLQINSRYNDRRDSFYY